MAHAAEASLGQIPTEVANAKNNSEREHTLRSFGKCTLALCNELHQFRPMNSFSSITISKFYRWPIFVGKRITKAFGINVSLLTNICKWW